jgi:hypothetical protein
MGSRSDAPPGEKNLNEYGISTDNGGRRSGGDRRTYSYTLYVPERRNGEDRRDGTDRRQTPRYKIPSG